MRLGMTTPHSDHADHASACNRFVSKNFCQTHLIQCLNPHFHQSIYALCFLLFSMVSHGTDAFSRDYYSVTISPKLANIAI